MSLFRHLLQSLRDALSVDTARDGDEHYLSSAIDHADLERRMAAQARGYLGMAPMNIGR